MSQQPPPLGSAFPSLWDPVSLSANPYYFILSTKGINSGEYSASTAHSRRIETVSQTCTRETWSTQPLGKKVLKPAKCSLSLVLHRHRLTTWQMPRWYDGFIARNFDAPKLLVGRFHYFQENESFQEKGVVG